MKIAYICSTVNLRKRSGAETHTKNITNEFRKLGSKVFLYTSGNFFVKLLTKFKLTYILAFFLLPKFRKCNVILERNQSLGLGYYISKFLDKSLFLEQIDDHVYMKSVKRARKIFAYTKILFPKKYWSKIIIMNAGTELDKYYPINMPQHYDVGFYGLFKEWDGVEDLVLAIRGTKLRALLIGGGKRFNKVKEMVNKFHLQNQIKLTGMIKPEQASELVAKCKIMVAPYNTKRSQIGQFKKYGFFFSPIKIFDYMAFGKPIIATDYPIIRKYIDENSGLLFREGDINDLRKKIFELLKKDLESIGRYNRKLAEKYTWRDVAKKMLVEMK